MFSLLIKYQKTHREILISAKSVEFIPPNPKAENPDEFAGLLVNHGVEAEGGCFLSVSEKDDPNWRDVFVMNDNGRTVARYTL